MAQQQLWQGQLYEKYLVPYLFEPWARLLVGIADPQLGERVLDVACGTGIAARTAAIRVGATGQVTGLDMNSGMIETARSLPQSSDAKFQWVQCSADSMNLEDDSVDVVLCQQGLQFFPDMLAGLKEMRRVLVPGGRLAVSVWTSPMPYSESLRKAVGQFISKEVGEGMSRTRSFGEPDELHSLVDETRFKDVNIRTETLVTWMPPAEEYVLNHLAATPNAAIVAAASDEARSALVQQISEELRPYREDGGIAVPNTSYIATAHA